MALDIMQTVEIIEVLENFVENNRPPEDIRDKLDLNYKIENQSVLLFEIRPVWDSPTEKRESFVARATFVKNINAWKVYWLRANQQWNSYTPEPVVPTLKDFLRVVKEDNHGCFWG